MFPRVYSRLHNIVSLPLLFRSAMWPNWAFCCLFVLFCLSTFMSIGSLKKETFIIASHWSREKSGHCDPVNLFKELKSKLNKTHTRLSVFVSSFDLIFDNPKMSYSRNSLFETLKNRLTGDQW